MEEDVAASYMYPSGYHSHSCGYCKSKPSANSKNYYAGSEEQSVHPAHYEELLLRGWRRSGTTWYKADAKHACCPHYSTRVLAHEFKPNKDQRRAVNVFNRHVLGPEYTRKAAELCPRSRAEVRHRKQVFETCAKIHEHEYSCLPRPIDRRTKKPIEPAHRFEVSLEPDTFTAEKYDLFAHYQRTTHKEPPHRISRDGFRGFLCSGLAHSEVSIDGRTRRIGSYHQMYRLDGRLVALGVLDLLPHAVSSVYLIYHEDVAHWEFGKLSAMREIAMAIEEGYGYYYMGYYIHSCTKMRYKRSFYPTYVLDPESLTWDLFDDGLARRMTARRYVSLSREKRLGIPEPSKEEIEALSAPLGPSRGQDKAGDSDNDSDDGNVVLGRLFDAGVPGTMTMEEVQREVDLNNVYVRVRGDTFNLGHLTWDLNRGTRSPLLSIAEFIACIGPDLARKIVLDLG